MDQEQKPRGSRSHGHTDEELKKGPEHSRRFTNLAQLLEAETLRSFLLHPNSGSFSSNPVTVPSSFLAPGFSKCEGGRTSVKSKHSQIRQNEVQILALTQSRYVISGKLPELSQLWLPHVKKGGGGQLEVLTTPTFFFED